MGWASIDDGFITHPKVTELMLDHDDPLRAVGLWTVALTWAYRHTIDKPPDEQGIIPGNQIRLWERSWGGAAASAEALAGVGLWERLPDGGYQIHDFRQWSHLDQREARIRGGKMTAHKRFGTPLPLDDSSATSSADSSATGAASSSANSSAPGELVASAFNSAVNSASEVEPKLGRVGKYFDAFWGVYPRRIGKAAAFKAFGNAVAGTGPHKQPTDPRLILEAATAYGDRVGGRDLKFIPHPATWLNQGRWADDPEPDEPVVRERGTFE